MELALGAHRQCGSRTTRYTGRLAGRSRPLARVLRCARVAPTRTARLRPSSWALTSPLPHHLLSRPSGVLPSRVLELEGTQGLRCHPVQELLVLRSKAVVDPSTSPPARAYLDALAPSRIGVQSLPRREIRARDSLAQEASSLWFQGSRDERLPRWALPAPSIAPTRPWAPPASCATPRHALPSRDNAPTEGFAQPGSARARARERLRSIVNPAARLPFSLRTDPSAVQLRSHSTFTGSPLAFQKARGLPGGAQRPYFRLTAVRNFTAPKVARDATHARFHMTRFAFRFQHHSGLQILMPAA